MADFQVGGQAVIEGVMIRSATHISTAVRRADNSILVKTTGAHAAVEALQDSFASDYSRIYLAVRDDVDWDCIVQFFG